MKLEDIRQSEKSGIRDLRHGCVLAAACMVFLYIAFNIYTQFLYEHLLIVPCMLFLGFKLERRDGYKPSRLFWLPVIMVAWFLILQMKRTAEYAQNANAGLFLSTYLFAFPLASLLQDGDEKKALKIFGSAYLAAAGILAVDGLLLVLDCLPDFLSERICWTGARLKAFWHPNITACFFMIGTIFCITFLLQAKSRRSKLGLCMLLMMMLGAMALTNCRTAIILTGGYLGAVVFFAAVKHGKKWFIPGVIAVLLLTVGFYAGANCLYQANHDALIKKYTQQYAEQTASEEEDTGSQEETLPIKVNSDTGEISLKTDNPQGSIQKDFGTLNSRTRIWKAALYAIRETPSILYWGMDNPGWYVSFYNSFQISHLHNSWMQCLVGMGVVGFIIAVLFTLVIAWNCLIVLLKHHRDIWKRTVALLTLWLMAASALEPYLFYTTVDYHPIDFLFFLCAGYLVHWQEEDNRRIMAAIRSRLPFLKK